MSKVSKECAEEARERLSIKRKASLKDVSKVSKCLRLVKRAPRSRGSDSASSGKRA